MPPVCPVKVDHCLVGEGWFWSAGGESRVRGELNAEAGRDVEVTLAGAVADDPRVIVEHAATGVIVTSVSGDPANDVAAFAPIDVQGQLDSGELVSLLSAQNHGMPGILGAPRYVARVAVFGAHIFGNQLYSAVRFRIDDPYWTAHLANGENHTLPDDGSVLRAVASEEGPDKGTWLVYESTQPRSLRDLDSRVLAGCRALARLAFDRPVAVRTIEIRINQDGGWLPLHSKTRTSPVSGYGESLLLREELTVQRFANWIALNSRLDGLASAVHDLGEGTIQTQVLTGTSLVEGLHRRLPYEQSQFPMASRSACDRVKRAARKAAAERAAAEEGMNPDLVHTAVKDAAGHFEDVGYRTRAQDIINKVTSVVPELVESVPDLAGKLMAARNDLAHHLMLNNEKESLTDRIDRWVAVSYVTPWLLRLLLLLHAGIESDVLHRACLGSQRFSFARANLAAIARDLGWLSAAE
jgi:Apea-like HEPN/ApeA N-terminal domain 1